jgi:error-prone DNA polymerase
MSKDYERLRAINCPFGSVNDLYRRVPQLRGNEMTLLAEVGALNSTYDPKQNANRRTALWDVAHALKSPGASLREPGN